MTLLILVENEFLTTLLLYVYLAYGIRICKAIQVIILKKNLELSKET